MVCDMLDRQFIRYVAIDNSPQKAIDARNKGLPVFFGDITRPEVLKSFDAGSAQACVIAINDIKITNRAVMTIRKTFPDLTMLVRAKNTQHQNRLESMFGKHFNTNLYHIRSLKLNNNQLNLTYLHCVS